MSGGGAVRRYTDLAERVLDAAPRLGPVRLVAVDGPSGSGKTTFASRLAAAVRGKRATVAEVHTDDLLDGWSDLVSFWPRLDEWILRQLGRGEPGRYRSYDWHRGCFDEQWQPVPVTDVVILDGVTSARAAGRPLCVLSVFMVVVDAGLRLRRGVARDGEEVRPYLRRWMKEEARHFAEDDTAAQVDLLVDGAPAVRHHADADADADAEYVQLGPSA